MKKPAVALAARLALAVVLGAVANTDAAALESSEGRIIGGQNATRGQFPWQVWIESYKTGLPFALLCGGSIIDSQWVLTAGHCVNFGVDAVNLTFGILLRNEITSETVVLRSTAILQHEDFYRNGDNSTNTFDIDNDIALIKLPTRLNFSDVIQPVKLPRRSQREKLFHGENVTVSGWGETKYPHGSTDGSNSLRFVDLEVAEDGKAPGINASCTEGHFICTKDPKRSAFFGDSGGPLVWKDEDGASRQIGIVSTGDRDNATHPELPVYVDLFTSVPHYLDWIVNKTGIEIDD